MVKSTNHHRPRWMPWFLWLAWAPVDALGCRNEETGVTEHSKITTALFVFCALVLHALRIPLAWWELLVLGALCFGSQVLFSTLLTSGIFRGEFLDSHEDSVSTTTESVTETIRQERDPVTGIDPA